MAYFSQADKKAIEPTIKAILKQFGLKGSLSVENSSTVVLTIQSGEIDFLGQDYVGTNQYSDQYLQLHVYHRHYENQFTGNALEFLNAVYPVLNQGNFDNSDIMTDYFHVGFYVNINIGKWNKPYIFNKVTETA